MVITLLWLTISTPFIYMVQENQLTFSIENPSDSEENETSNQLIPNPSEEKTEKNSNNISEYLNHHDLSDSYSSSRVKYGLALSTQLYLSFYGELLTPPPNRMV